MLASTFSEMILQKNGVLSSPFKTNYTQGLPF